MVRENIMAIGVCRVGHVKQEDDAELKLWRKSQEIILYLSCDI
jgi:hypothetical protein